MTTVFFSLTDPFFGGCAALFMPSSVAHYNFTLLTVWRRNYFFLILTHPVYKM